jgi:hypothetical protein
MVSRWYEDRRRSVYFSDNSPRESHLDDGIKSSGYGTSKFFLVHGPLTLYVSVVSCGSIIHRRTNYRQIQPSKSPAGN